ncbi:MAG: hypothetical protein ABSC20_06280 [Candidatus Bathyarchaeia archaeon]|jgi:hypothetical protein
MYQNNLVYWLRDKLYDMVTIDKTHINEERFFELHEKQRKKTIYGYDWSQLTIPEQYLILDEPQKESIRDFITSFISDSLGYETYLSLLCHIGYVYEQNNLNNTESYSALLANYQFLKQLWNQAYPLQYEGFESEKSACVMETSQPTIKPQRPLCIECGCDTVISKGEQWRCRSCGKSWVKVRHNRQNNS